jgi:hypothetical protein
VAFSPDGRRLALAGEDGTAKVFEVPAGLTPGPITVVGQPGGAPGGSFPKC